MTKPHPTVQTSGASLSAGGAGARAMGRPSSTASNPRAASRTIVETAACPPELKRGDKPWQVAARPRATCRAPSCAPVPAPLPPAAPVRRPQSSARRKDRLTSPLAPQEHLRLSGAEDAGGGQHVERGALRVLPLEGARGGEDVPPGQDELHERQAGEEGEPWGRETEEAEAGGGRMAGKRVSGRASMPPLSRHRLRGLLEGRTMHGRQARAACWVWKSRRRSPAVPQTARGPSTALPSPHPCPRARCLARLRSTPRCCTPTSCACSLPLRTRMASTWCRSTRRGVSCWLLPRGLGLGGWQGGGGRRGKMCWSQAPACGAVRGWANLPAAETMGRHYEEGL